ncbi:MAG TPA: hypothetical protein ENN21_09625, partial [Spirochaetes bacterium]|nr:hypothetical protein [Spirochaetota bacterium]
MKTILKPLAFSFLIIVAGLSAAPGKSARILVYPFENIGSPEYSWLSAGMTDSVISDLKKIKGVSVVSDEERRRALGEIELEMRGAFDARAGSRVGILTGADLVFSGNYVVLGGKMRVLCKLI